MFEAASPFSAPEAASVQAPDFVKGIKTRLSLRMS